ncbi:MAG: NADH-quinone oxidoreductase subunit I [Armatimonadetes bacterium]|nr:NADH-quinone oxidoreductase subunit I [Armatimonadota bacterium]
MSKRKKLVEYVGEAWYTIYSIVAGHIVTFINLFRRKVTLQYPEVKWDLPQGYRGLITLPVDPKTGEDKCIGCQACVKVCPTQVIDVPTHQGEDKKRVVDGWTAKIGQCMFCQLCVEACPTQAIVMSDGYELATFSREETVYDRKRLNELGGSFPETPDEEPVAAAKEGE